MSDLKDEIAEFAEVETNVPLSSMTTLRIGGIASYVVYPDNMVALDALMQIVRRRNIPHKVIGKGSNLLCSDNSFDGVIFRLDKFDDNYIRNDCMIAQSGCSIIALSYEAMRNGLSGLEFASGIPGTAGGVTFMNAGAYKSAMSEVVESVFVYRDGRFEWISREECGFGYRASIFQQHPDWVILAVRMHLKHGNTDEIRALMDSRRSRRMASQPLDKPSAGSVFRNPDDVPAWKLIEGIGYRGKKIGGAKVSDKHVNFIINDGGATAEDFLTLVNDIKTRVKEKYNIDLHMEVERFNW